MLLLHALLLSATLTLQLEMLQCNIRSITAILAFPVEPEHVFVVGLERELEEGPLAGGVVGAGGRGAEVAAELEVVGEGGVASAGGLGWGGHCSC